MASPLSLLRPADVIGVRACRSDGACYRWWTAAVERTEPTLVVVRTPPGTMIAQGRGGWVQRHDIRAYYWLDRRYSLLEVYRPDGTLEELYLHIASPARVRRRTLVYVDLELDVVKRPGEAGQLIDEDELAQAALTYRYSADFQAACRAAAEALHLVATWTPAGLASIGQVSPERQW